jgi:anti-sigma factor RsiW
MSSIEEKLWNYIDGTCTPDEQEAIARLIAQDEIYRRKYNELLKLNAEFAAIELDEPPMAFTYNVMEAIRTENAQQQL